MVINMKKRGFAESLRRKQYVIAGTLVVIAVIGTTIVYSNRQSNEREQMEAQLAQEMAEEQIDSVTAEEETEDVAQASAVIPPQTEQEEETETETAEILLEETKTSDEGNEEKQVAAKSETLHFSPEDGMQWPMEGDVVLNYSMDKTIYFPTLEQFKCNPAIIIAGEVNDKVYSVAKGQVLSIENNEETGCTVTVDLGDGYQAIYGQLKELTFQEGDYVDMGHVIGYLSEPTKYYAVEGSSLYFELQKDGNPINPIEFFES